MTLCFYMYFGSYMSISGKTDIKFLYFNLTNATRESCKEKALVVHNGLAWALIQVKLSEY